MNSTITPDTFPAGARVESTANPDVRGVVAGWVRGDIVIRWDGGGTSSAPAHFGGIRPEHVAEPEDVDFGELTDSAEPVICGECCRGNYVVMSGSRAICYLCGHEIAPRDLDPDPDYRIVWGENGSIIIARDASSELDR